MDKFDIKDVKEMILSDVDPKARAAKKREQRRTAILTIAEFVLVILLVLIAFFIWLGSSTVTGDSMYPTLHNGDKVIYQRHNSEYRVNDIVAIKMGSGKVYVKRIVAVAGDTVNLSLGKAYVNGKEVATSEAIGTTNPTPGSNISYPYVVRDDEYFVLGDNREVSDDSRNFGAISRSKIMGKIIYYVGSVYR